MKTRDEILKLWNDYDSCPDFSVVLEELLNDIDKNNKEVKEHILDLKNKLASARQYLIRIKHKTKEPDIKTLAETVLELTQMEIQ